MKTALCDGAKTKLGYEDRKQPDWTRESEKDLKTLFAERNLYDLWISTRRDVYKAKYKAAQRTARQEQPKTNGFSIKLLKRRGGCMVGRWCGCVFMTSNEDEEDWYQLDQLQ